MAGIMLLQRVSDKRIAASVKRRFDTQEYR